MSIRSRKRAERMRRRAFWAQWSIDSGMLSGMLREMSKTILRDIFAPDRAADDGWPPAA